MRKLKQLLRKSLLLVFALAVGFVLGEVALRIAGVGHPRISERHEYRGTAYRPGAEWSQSREGKAYIRINDEGFRDRQWQLEKPAGTVRIAVLGDSYVDAQQVEVGARFTEILQEELQSCARLEGKNVEVLNFGVSGYGTGQEFLTFRHNVVKFAPDLVIIAVLTGNDIRNNSEKLQGDPGRPYFVYRDGELVLDASFRDTSFHKQPWWKKLAVGLISYSRVLQVANEVRRTWIERREEGQRREHSGPNAGALEELGLDSMVYVEPEFPAWKEAWTVTEGILSKMRHEVEAAGAAFLVVTLTNGMQVHPDAALRSRFQQELGVRDLFYPDNRIRDLAAREGFEAINLAPRFQRHAVENNVYLHGFENTKLGSGHWNANGHRLAGEIIAEKVCRDFEF